MRNVRHREQFPLVGRRSLAGINAVDRANEPRCRLFVERILDCVNCDPWHPYISLLQADGAFEIERNRRFGKGDLFRTGSFLRRDPRDLPVSANNMANSSNLWSGAPSGLQLDDVRVLDDGSIEVTLDAPTTGQCEERLCAEGEGCAPITCEEAPRPQGCTSVDGLAPALGLLLLLEERFRRRPQHVLRGA